jgi:hypothetical protein
MAFIQDPRMRQRWNEIQHTTETVTENAAAGIWTFQHRYITPCLASICDSLDVCTSLCIGDREERARRARERDRGARRSRAIEYTFDFYDDWDDDLIGGSGYGGVGGYGSDEGVGGIHWDRILAGTGSARRQQDEGDVAVVGEQPRRKKGMSYGGTRAAGKGKRKLAPDEDPTVIPSTAPLGFLGRLPFKIGGTLRYKPSAANLKEHPGHLTRTDEGADAEHMPLLATNEEEDGGRGREDIPNSGSKHQPRMRSNTAGSGATSDSYRSRNDLFPSDGEGEEDAVPLDDEFAVALDRVDADRVSNRTRSSKGKRPADGTRPMSRTLSKSTMASSGRGSFASIGEAIEIATPSLEDLQREEEQAKREEDEELGRRREAARRLARERGLSVPRDEQVPTSAEDPTADTAEADGADDPLGREFGLPHDEDLKYEVGSCADAVKGEPASNGAVTEPDQVIVKPAILDSTEAFVPARLPHFR